MMRVSEEKIPTSSEMPDSVEGNDPVALGKRIVVVTNKLPPDFSGSGLRAFRHAVFLHENGMLAFICTETKRVHEEKEGMEIVNIPVESDKLLSKVGLTISIRRFLSTTTHLLKTIIFWAKFFYSKRNKFDVLHCFGVGNVALCCIAVNLFFRKKILIEITVLPDENRGSVCNPFKFLTNLRRYIIVNLCDKLVAISPSIHEYLKRKGIGDSRIQLIPNGTNVKRFFPRSDLEKRKLRKKHGFGSNEVLILSVGALTKRKGLDITLKSFMLFRKNVPNSKLLHCGGRKGAGQDALKHEILAPLLREGLPEKDLIFLGVVTNVEEYMQIADIMLFPSRREGFANVLIEAMACGLCVVSHKIDQLTDYIITDGVDGVLIDSENHEEYARALLYLINSPKKMNEMSRQAVECVKKRFTESKIFCEYLELYSTL